MPQVAAKNTQTSKLESQSLVAASQAWRARFWLLRVLVFDGEDVALCFFKFGGLGLRFLLWESGRQSYRPAFSCSGDVRQAKPKAKAKAKAKGKAKAKAKAKSKARRAEDGMSTTIL